MDSKFERRSTRSTRTAKDSESETKDSSSNEAKANDSDSLLGSETSQTPAGITTSSKKAATSKAAALNQDLVDKSADDEETKPEQQMQQQQQRVSVKTRSNRNSTTQQPQQSTIVTRKRQMSFSSDLKNSLSKANKNEAQLNLDSYLNEDSNSSSVSGCPLNSSLNGHLSTALVSSYKKLKIGDSAATTADTEDTDSVMNCPIQGCTSEGHLDGLTERHFSFDTCPIYFGMTSAECMTRRKEIEQRLVDLEKKLSQHSTESPSIGSHSNTHKKADLGNEKMKLTY